MLCGGVMSGPCVGMERCGTGRSRRGQVGLRSVREGYGEVRHDLVLCW